MYKFMSIKNIKINLLFWGLFFIACSYSMKRKHEGQDYFESSAKKQKLELIERSHEEQNFILSVRKWEKDLSKLAALKIVIKNILSTPNNEFFKKIKTILQEASLAGIKPQKLNLLNIPTADLSTVKINKYIYRVEIESGDINMYIQKDGEEDQVIKLMAAGSIKQIKLSPSANYLTTLEQDNNKMILKLWDITDRKSPKNIGSVENWLDNISYLRFEENTEDIIHNKSRRGVINIWKIKFLKINLPEIFKNLESETTKIGDRIENTGLIKYLLLNAIFEHKKTNKPFKITYPRLKAVFNLLPEPLKEALINLSYVQIS